MHSQWSVRPHLMSSPVNHHRLLSSADKERPLAHGLRGQHQQNIEVNKTRFRYQVTTSLVNHMHDFKHVRACKHYEQYARHHSLQANSNTHLEGLDCKTLVLKSHEAPTAEDKRGRRVVCDDIQGLGYASFELNVH